MLPILALALMSLSLCAADNKMLLLKDDKSFVVVESYDNESCPEVVIKRVPNYMVDKSIREVSGQKLAQAVARGSVYVQLQRTNDGGYAVHALPKGLGSGPVGAAFGAVAGEVVGYAVVKIGGELVLRGTWRCICMFGSAQSAEAFGDKMIDRLLPGVERVAERVGHAAGAAGAVIGGSVSPV